MNVVFIKNIFLFIHMQNDCGFLYKIFSPFLSTCNYVINVDTHTPVWLYLPNPHRVLSCTGVGAAEINLSSSFTSVPYTP